MDSERAGPLEDVERTVWGIGTSRTLRVHWVLAELSLPYRCVEVLPRSPEMGREDFLARSQRRKVPWFEEGPLSMGESGAIVATLAERHRARADLLPLPGTLERAHSEDRSLFILMEIDAPLYIIRRHEGLAEVYGVSETAVRAAREYVTRSLGEAERWLEDDRTHVLGPRFGTVDLLLISCLEWARLVGIELSAPLEAYRARVTARPAYRAAVGRNFPPGVLEKVTGASLS